MQTIVYTTAEYAQLNDEQHITMDDTRERFRYDLTQALAGNIDDYDIDAILDDYVAYIETVDDEGHVILRASGFVARTDIDPTFDEAAFWDLVARCEK